MSYLDDPRVLFATERTLLAWNRTAITLMGFGFMVERFGLFLHVVLRQQSEPLHRGITLFIGVCPASCSQWPCWRYLCGNTEKLQ